MLAAAPILAAAAVSACSTGAGPSAGPDAVATPVATGFDVLRDEGYRCLAGRKVGVVANPTSVDAALDHIVDVMHRDGRVALRAIFGPEHGFRGSAQAGASEPRAVDPRTGLPVFDIYARHGAALDAILREAGVDTVLFDIQDVGARFYTYDWTLFDVMEAAARLGLRVVVLDRPNPIGGLRVAGPVLEPRLASFVGRAPVPVIPGLTIGELARLFNRVFLARPVGLDVVRLRGWRRDMLYARTGLPWVPPSPNMPTPDTALAYPGTCLFEGTDLSVGRGTTSPFLLLGAPRIDAARWRAALVAARLPGVLFRSAFFTPGFSVASGQLCQGVELVITDPVRFDPMFTALTLLDTLRVTGQPARFRDDGSFDRLAGTPTLRRGIEAGTPLPEIVAGWQPGLRDFARRRAEVLLYD